MYLIQAKRSGERWQTIDRAATEAEARRKYGEHRVRLGPEWIMVLVFQADEKEGK